MFIGPPKLVFIKTTEGTQALRPGAPKGQTILVAPAPTTDTTTTITTPTPSSTVTLTNVDDNDDTPPPRILRRHAAERKYGKRQKIDVVESEESKDNDEQDNASISSSKYLYSYMTLGICKFS